VKTAPRGGVRATEAIGVLGALGLVGYHTFLNRHYQLDDALIYYRYVRNALAGQGLVYNPGERVNALTSPLYSYVSVAVAWLTKDVQASQMMLGAVFLGLTVVLVYALFRDMGLAPYGAATAVLIASTRYLYQTFGLETALFLFLLTLALWLYLRDRLIACGFVLGLLLLTRGEGILLAGVLLVEHWRRRGHRLPSRAVAAFGLPVLPHLAFTLYYYGDLVPETLVAKVAQGRSGLWGESRLLFLDIRPVYLWLFDHRPILPLLLLALAGLGVVKGWRRRFPRLLAIHLLLYTGLYTWLQVPFYPWYYAPHLYAGCVFAGLGLAAVGGPLPAAASPRRVPWRSLAAGALLGVLVALSLSGAQSLRWSGPVAVYRDIGLWLARNTATDSRIACVEIGTIGWYSDRPIIDPIGLVSPHNARLLGERDFAGWLRYHDPDYVLVRAAPWNKEPWVAVLLAGGRYAPRPDFPFPAHRLLERASSRPPEKP
jgi:arabinofuranosyltransferase